MDLFKRLSLLMVVGVFACARQLPEDPVMKARAQRAQAQGINEADLPPVPRSVLEPPPLPPPELHLKDSRQGRAGKAQGKAHAKGAKGGKVAKHPARSAKKPGRTKKKVKA
jgi:hypothetical protein